MRKRIIRRDTAESVKADPAWLDLERLAEVEVTSEESAHPIEAALIPGFGAGWQAAEPGEQTIRLLFDKPQAIRKIGLRFRAETGGARTQEFVLSWAGREAQPAHEIVRQQYNFSPPGVTVEVEDYSVRLDGVRVLELRIIPDISGGALCASLEHLRIA